MTRYRLSDLVAQMTPENRRPEIDFGPPVGKEFGAPPAQPRVPDLREIIASAARKLNINPSEQWITDLISKSGGIKDAKAMIDGLERGLMDFDISTIERAMAYHRAETRRLGQRRRRLLKAGIGS